MEQRSGKVEICLLGLRLTVTVNVAVQRSRKVETAQNALHAFMVILKKENALYSAE